MSIGKKYIEVAEALYVNESDELPSFWVGYFGATFERYAEMFPALKKEMEKDISYLEWRLKKQEEVGV
jgi:predicted DNA-binding transcriptional regulator